MPFIPPLRARGVARGLTPATLRRARVLTRCARARLSSHDSVRCARAQESADVWKNHALPSDQHSFDQTYHESQQQNRHTWWQ